MLLFARFETVDDAAGDTCQLRFGRWESDLIDGYYAVDPQQPVVMDLVAAGEAVGLRVAPAVDGLRPGLSCTEGKSLADVAKAVGVQAGDYAKFTLQDDGAWVMELGDLPGLFSLYESWLSGDEPLTPNAIKTHFSTTTNRWTALQSHRIPPELLEEYRTVQSRGTHSTWYLAHDLGVPLQVELTGEVTGVLFSQHPEPSPGFDEAAVVKSQLWIDVKMPMTEQGIPLHHFVTALSGQNLKLYSKWATNTTGPVRYVGAEGAPVILPDLLDSFGKAGKVPSVGDKDVHKFRRHYLHFRLFARSISPFGATTRTVTPWKYQGYCPASISAHYKEKGLHHLPVCLSITARKDTLEISLNYDTAPDDPEACNAWISSFDPRPLLGQYLHLWTTVPKGGSWTIDTKKPNLKPTITAMEKELAAHPDRVARVGYRLTKAEVAAEGENLSFLIADNIAKLVDLYRSVAGKLAEQAPRLFLLTTLPEPDKLGEAVDLTAAGKTATLRWNHRLDADLLRQHLPVRLYLTDCLPTGERCATHEAEVSGFEPNGLLRLSSLSPLNPLRKLTTWVDYATGKPIDPDALLKGFVYAEETATPPPSPARRSLKEIRDAFAASNSLIYAKNDLNNLYHALHALEHKHFVILHGVSGTGKSQFAQAYTNALYGTADLKKPGNAYYCLVTVQPTWQDRTALLGYYNPLTRSYVITDFLRHMLAAHRDPDHDYVVCLDEMNLAVVEHYFADFLSAWESQEAIALHTFPEHVANVPARLQIPKNLYVIGTVNVDETTHGFSPKVLDRAFAVEFSEVDVTEIGRKFAGDGEPQYQDLITKRVIPLLKTLYALLKGHNLHFAYRTISEICRYMLQNAKADNDDRLDVDTALDLMLVQKVLPKLRGDDRQKKLLKELRQAIGKEFGVTINDDEKEPTFTQQSLTVLTRLMADLRDYGSFQFWR